MAEPKEGDLRVWWIPQVPMEAFYASVETLDEAKRLTDTLARYDHFQFENNVKPDYSNAGGITKYIDGIWCDYDEEYDQWA